MYFPLNFSRLFMTTWQSFALPYLISTSSQQFREQQKLKQLCIIISNGIVLVLQATYFGSFCPEVFLVLVFKSTINLSFMCVVDINIILPIF